MRCWLTLPTTTSVQSGAHTFTSSMRAHTMRMTATLGLQVFPGPTPRRVPPLQVVCSIMQTTTMQMQRSPMAPASSLLTLHRPRSTCVSILTQPTAVRTAVAARMSLIFRASTTTEPSPLLDQRGTLISPDSPTMVRAPARDPTFAMRSTSPIPQPSGLVSRTRIWLPN